MRDKNFLIGAFIVSLIFLFLQVTKPELYISDRGLLLFLILLFGGILQFSTRHALRGGDVFLRTIPGVKAVEEAVGRSTEMGKPVLYVPGIQDMDQVETVAGVVILGHVSKMTARYETPLNVPVARSIVLKAAQEACKESYLVEGRSDIYNENMVHYVTDDQFAYAAGVNGIMNREKPAACLYMGKFTLNLFYLLKLVIQLVLFKSLAQLHNLKYLFLLLLAIILLLVKNFLLLVLIYHKNLTYWVL